jgi:hypothetical protein
MSLSAPQSQSPLLPDIGANLRKVQAEVAAAARAAGREPADVRIVAVTKTHGPERVRPSLIAGHRLFGENRVQEAEDKWPALRAEFPNLRLHLIGPLQGNKVRAAVRLFDVIETVDSAKLAERIQRIAAAEKRQLDCFVQVNTGDESQKAGVAPEAADALIAECRERLGLPVKGLMCIPPLDEEPSPHFALLREIGRRNGIHELSMGMSADYKVAVAFGATLVRVGTAIFGAREPYPPAG